MARAPFDARAELKDLCDWLVCCKHLWPQSQETSDEIPFSLHASEQSPRFDPERFENTVYAFLGERDAELLKDINSYLFESGESHWQALKAQKHPGASIDPKGAPRHWPVECLRWAIYTFDMRDADLSWANLSGMHLCGADLQRTDLQYACMDGADMRGVELACADIEGATFRETNLEGARLDKVKFGTDKNRFEGANLDGASLKDITLDVAPNALDNGLLHPLVDRHVRKNLNYRVKQAHGSLAIKYLSRFLPHIEVFSADLCKDCLKLTPAEDRAALLQKFVSHAVDLHDKGKLDDIKSFYEAIDIPVYRQFLNRIDKENLDVVRKILKDICKKMPDYPKSASQNDAWREFLTASIEACQKLGLATTRRLLKDITVVIFREVKTSAEGIASIGLALEHLGDANPAPAFQTLIRDLSPERLGSLIWEDLVVAANRPLSSDAATTASAAGPAGKETSPAPIRQGNLRQLIDLLHEWLPSDIQIHTLLQEDADEMNEAGKSQTPVRVLEGDCDYLDSYTADDIGGTHAAIGGAAANLHADQMASDDAPRTPTPAWQSALFAYMLLPASHFLERYAAGYSFSTVVAARDAQGQP